MGILRSLLPALLLSPLALQAQLPTTPVTGDVSVHVEQVMQSAFGQRYMGTVATANNSNLKPGDRVMLATVGQGGLQIAMAPIGGRMMAHTTSASAVTSGAPQVGSVLCFSSTGSCGAGSQDKQSTTASTARGSSKASNAGIPPHAAGDPSYLNPTAPHPHLMVMEGVGLGMIFSDIQAAAEANGGKMYTSQGGYVAMKTKDIDFAAIQFDDQGYVSSYKAVGMSRGATTSGPLVDLAKKAFGPPTKVDGSGVHWGVEGSGKVNAQYNWEASEAPTGELIVTSGTD